jgi:hypothetical protein
MMGNLMQDDEFISAKFIQSNQSDSFPVSVSHRGMISIASLNQYL